MAPLERSAGDAYTIVVEDACAPIERRRFAGRNWVPDIESDGNGEEDVLPPIIANLSDTLAGAVAVDVEAQGVRCRQAEGGTMSLGLGHGVTTLIALSREISAEAPALLKENATPVNLFTPENRERLARMAALENPHMRDAFLLVQDVVGDLIWSGLSEGQDVLNIVTWVFASFFLAIVAVFYWPRAWQLQESLQSARELLTLVPEEVLEVVTPLRRGLQVIATKQETSEVGLPGLGKGSAYCSSICRSG